MTIYAVMIRDGLNHRWIDSLWIFRHHSNRRCAEARKSELAVMFEAMKAEHSAWIVPMELEDAELGTREAENANREGQPDDEAQTVNVKKP